MLDQATTQKLDKALDAQKLPFVEKLRFRHALAAHRLIPFGRPVQFSTKTPDMLDPWAAKFK